MKILRLTLLLSISFIKACSTEVRASEPSDIECKILNAWDFKRCENSEVICYMSNDGLSCVFKK